MNKEMTTNQNYSRARTQAERVKGRAFWREVLAKVRGVPNELLPFEEVRAHFAAGESYGGVRPIPIQQIVGSVDRYRDFDHYFLPRVNAPINRWIGIRHARLEGVELPAIQVYKIGEVYFVKDGHHRVSVAKEEGQKFIDAEIIELNVPVNPSSGDSLKDMVIKGEYGRFLLATNLGELRPDSDISFSVPGRYDILLDHIRTHQYYLGTTYNREFSWDEAVQSWYDTLYLPVVKEIREHNVLRRFPGRTEADLYLWVMDHRYNLSQIIGQDVGEDVAAQDYAENYAPSLLRRVWQRLRGG